MKKYVKFSLLFLLSIIFNGDIFAQGVLDNAKETSDIKEMQLKHGYYEKGYLTTLSREQRIELFKSYSYINRKWDDNRAIKFAEEKEEEFEKQLKFIEDLSQKERESWIIDPRPKQNMTAKYYCTILNEDIFTEISKQSFSSPHAKEALETFNGLPVYIIKYYYINTNGVKDLYSVRIKLKKTITDIWAVGFIHASNP
ncbi:hypothetical protein [Sphingobacterium siyangense]|uniref:hypothetical protein n=1 Tax=Sphingobacterium siyangense TaxID=459529 RepID=UPI003C7758D7